MAFTTEADTRGAGRRALLDLSGRDVVVDLRTLETTEEHESIAGALGARLVDLVAAAVLIIATAPLFLLVVLAVRSTSRGPAVYVEPHTGRGGHLFLALRFRTAIIDDAQQTSATALPTGSAALARTYVFGPGARVTVVGHLLRGTGLDRLPQLWNVLVGDMSLFRRQL